MSRQLDSSYYQRYMLSDGKSLPSFKSTIDEDEYPHTRILDTYSLECRIYKAWYFSMSTIN